VNEAPPAPRESPDSPGIYVHLPYCRTRCGYCAFVVTTDDSTRDAYLGALELEAAIVEKEAAGVRFDSIYLGGGTPSLIPTDGLARLLAGLRRRFDVLPGAEVTMEANPDDVTLELARACKAAGVTRISTGVQSLDDRELEAVGRRHDARAARDAVESLLRSGLSVAADLILGLPEQTRETFTASAAELARSGVEHLSIYLLETDKSKAIEEDRRERPDRYLTDDAQADLWLETGENFHRLGLRHYEISNWSRPGREARHNVKYWRRVPTLGLGVSAHELWSDRRRANVSALPVYLDSLNRGTRPTALDRPLAAEERARERIFLGLRLREGVPATEIEDVVRRSPDRTLPQDYRDWFEAGLLRADGGRVCFSERGFLLSNEVLCRFV
jgi:oxygen-independent coproporphyrinogen-3 oxidase